MPERFDVAVIGAGAAGMMAAAVAGQRGRKVVLIEHAKKLAEKIRISGGGRCNFTNINTAPINFLSENPHFCRSALARYGPQDFLTLIRKYRVPYHEKHKGQLFCDDSSQRIIDLLVKECEAGNVAWRRPCTVRTIQKQIDGFKLVIDGNSIDVARLVVATGGLSIPKIGATDFGYRIARQFNMPVIAPKPALVPLTFGNDSWSAYRELAGISLEVDVTCREGSFREDLLFTHRGLSGPAILQISSYWQDADILKINLVPQLNLEPTLIATKSGNRQHVSTVLAQWMPKRLAEIFTIHSGIGEQPIAEVSNSSLRMLARQLNNWSLTPNGSEGYRKAEVTRGGVDTRALDSRNMEAVSVPGLHFVGEVVDVTGWLGGYNFQWAWASGVAAGMAV